MPLAINKLNFNQVLVNLGAFFDGLYFLEIAD
jgi:hypothetical protein